MILVVTGEPNIRGLVRSALEETGFTVAEAANGREAISRLSEDVRLVLMDLVMPDLDGIQLAQEIHRRRPELLVLLMAGAFPAGVDPDPGPCLRQPLDVRKLVHDVQQLIGPPAAKCVRAEQPVVTRRPDPWKTIPPQG